jgi:hypothetical protein
MRRSKFSSEYMQGAAAQIIERGHWRPYGTPRGCAHAETPLDRSGQAGARAVFLSLTRARGRVA